MKMWLLYTLILMLIHHCLTAPATNYINATHANVESLGNTGAGNANEFVDEAISHWRDLLKESGYDPLYVKSFTQGMITCRSCQINGLSTIQRTGDVMLNTSETFFVIDLNIGFIEITASCQCEAKWTIFSAGGEMFGTLTDYSLAGRIEQYSSTRRSPELSSLKITNEGQLSTHFDGKGFFGTLLQWFGQDFIRNRIKQMITNSSEMRNLLSRAMENLDISKVLSF